METATLTRAMKREALRPFREEWQYASGDERSAALGHWFGVADVLYHANEPVPHAWRYRHGGCHHNPIENYHADGEPCPRHGECEHCPSALSDGSPAYECDCQEEREYVPFLDAGETGIAMLLYAGRVLDRYCGWLQRAEGDY